MEVDWQSKSHGSEGLQVTRDSEGLQTIEARKRTSLWHNYKGENGDGRGERILGLSVKAFWIVVVVLVMILAGGIGGGVGGGLAAQNKNSNKAAETSSSSQSSESSQSSTPPHTTVTVTPSPTSSSSSSTSVSSTTSSSPSGGPSPIIRTPCIDDPSSNNTLISAHDASGGSSISAFTLLCNTNYPSGPINPNVEDLLRIWVPDMNACVAQCAQYNLGYAVGQGQSPKCVAVAVVRRAGEYCFLKSGTGRNDTSTSGGAPIDTAVLINA